MMYGYNDDPVNYADEYTKSNKILQETNRILEQHIGAVAVLKAIIKKHLNIEIDMSQFKYIYCRYCKKLLIAKQTNEDEVVMIKKFHPVTYKNKASYVCCDRCNKFYNRD